MNQEDNNKCPSQTDLFEASETVECVEILLCLLTPCLSSQGQTAARINCLLSSHTMTYLFFI